MAQLWSWATESPLAHFTPEDFELFYAAADEALNQKADDSEVSWRNPDTGHSGSVKVFGTTQVGEETCREALVINQAKSIKGSLKYFVCKQDDGKWRVTTPQ
jgi:surface antigen